MKQAPKGFIALMSAVIISAILLTAAITGCMSGFLERGNILNSELKERSLTAADACADKAFFLITNDATYTGLSVYILNSLDSCRALVSGVNTKTVKIQATSSNAAVTNLIINYSATTSTVLSWQETAVF